MKLIMCLVAMLLSVASFAGNNDEQAIRNLLTAQVVEWNKGNIEGYMKGYWEDDSLLFIGKSGPTYGYTPTLNRYKKSYPGTEKMGKLTSTIVSLSKLSDKYYFVVGKWHLERKVGNLEGSYTLLLKKIDGQWVIIADHSS